MNTSVPAPQPPPGADDVTGDSDIASAEPGAGLAADSGCDEPVQAQADDDEYEPLV